MKKMLTLTLYLMVLASCTTMQTQLPSSTDIPQANLPNPASVYCQEQGFQSEIRTAPDGSQTGICRFPDGKYPGSSVSCSKPGYKIGFMP